MEVSSTGFCGDRVLSLQFPSNNIRALTFHPIGIVPPTRPGLERVKGEKEEGEKNAPRMSSLPLNARPALSDVPPSMAHSFKDNLCHSC